MLRSRIGWLGAGLLTLGGVACGGSSHDDTNDDAPNAGKASAGRAAAGTAGTATAGRGGASGSAGTGATTSAGRGGSAGSTAGSGTGGASAGKSGGGAGRGGSAGSVNGGRGGTAGTGGDAGAAEGGVDPGIVEDLHDLHDAVATACGAAQTCCVANGITPIPLDDCQAMYDMNYESVAGITEGYITVDSAALTRCKGAYGTASSQCNLNAVVAACEGVFVGHQGVGEPCIGGYDCDRAAGAMSCMITDTSGAHNLGNCQKIPRAKLNEPCSGSCRLGEDCSNTAQGFASPADLAVCYEEDGLFCDYLESGSICHTIIAVGQPCGEASYGACGSHAQCNTSCEALSDLGESCGSCFHQYQCIDGKCADPNWATDSSCMYAPPGP